MNFFRSYDMAVDIGTATMRATTSTGWICEQKSLCGDTPALARGVISSPEAAIGVLKPLFRKSRSSRLLRPRILACAPTDATSIERAALERCIRRAGASAVIIIPEPLAAAVGAGIDIASVYSKLVVDFGEGVTDCALIHKGRVIESRAVRVGCANLRKALQDWMLEGLQISIPDADADHLLRVYGVMPGKAVAEPAPPLEASAEFVWKAVHAPVARMLEALKSLMQDLPPSFGAEVIEDGIFLTGGGALLPGMSKLVEDATGIHTSVAPHPLASVIHGARAMLPLAATLKLWK